MMRFIYFRAKVFAVSLTLILAAFGLWAIFSPQGYIQIIFDSANLSR